MNNTQQEIQSHFLRMFNIFGWGFDIDSHFKKVNEYASQNCLSRSEVMRICEKQATAGEPFIYDKR